MTDADTDAWGIGRGYHDVWGRWREPAPEVAAALRRAMGATADDPDEVPPLTRFVVTRTGRADEVRVDEPGWLTLEDGTQVKVRRHLPADLPLGLHRFDGDGGRSRPYRKSSARKGDSIIRSARLECAPPTVG